jgi:hypothetical protein
MTTDHPAIEPQHERAARAILDYALAKPSWEPPDRWMQKVAAILARHFPAPAPQPTPREQPGEVGYKSRPDAVGLWEFRHKQGIRKGYHQWWDGEHLRFSQDGPMSGLRVEDCTDFFGPLVPAAEAGELRRLAENTVHMLQLIQSYTPRQCGDVMLHTVQFDEKAIKAELEKYRAALATEPSPNQEVPHEKD